MNLRWLSCGWLACALGVSSILLAQTESQYLGSGSCARCHETPSPTDIQSGATGRVCLTEWKTWTNADRHANAHSALKGDRGQRIGKLLGKDVLAAQTGCIQCHNTTASATEVNASALTATLSEGVGCESCHGPSSKWQNDHWRFPDWQQKTAEQCHEQGWFEIKSPIVRAEVCASCHIGDAKQNRLITHDMYAAGHPPLSGFEIESFADNMPRHWMFSYERANPEPSFDRTRNVLVGSVVALRKSVELAMSDASAPSESKRWPELARLDCFACHHELTSQDWRQSPVSLTTPGRPQLAVGCLPLVAVAAQIVGVEQNSVAAQLQEPFAKNIFGDPQLLAQNGDKVVDWCKELENRLVGQQYNAKTAHKVLHAIAAQAESKPCDYDTARQLFGAWQVVFDELIANAPQAINAEARVEANHVLQRLNGNNLFAMKQDVRKSPCGPFSKTQLTELKYRQDGLVHELFRTRMRFDTAAFERDMTELANLVGK